MIWSTARRTGPSSAQGSLDSMRRPFGRLMGTFVYTIIHKLTPDSFGIHRTTL
jgi:hypothetical protein